MKNKKIYIYSFMILLTIVVLLFVILRFPNLLQRKEVYQANEIDILQTRSGERMLANGNCNKDYDCSPTGCSKQVCDNHEVVTTCELIDVPQFDTYTCGCIESSCVWYRITK